MLGKCSQHVHHQLIGMGIVRRDEIDATFDKAGDEMDISSQTVEFRNDQGRPGLLGTGNGSRELGPIRPPATLDFAEFPDKFASLAGKMPEDRLALGVQAKAAPPLAIGRNAVVGDKLA